jgi:hypothetical protein
MDLRPKELDWNPPHRECLEGTRQDILKDVEDWMEDFTAPNILWLKGHPGVGKSAIAASLVSRLQSSNRLGSSFVFRRETATITTPTALWRVVAFDLARRYPAIKRNLVERLNTGDVHSATVNMANLFRHLIHEPLASTQDIPEDRLPVVVVDGLDECGGTEGQYSEHRKNLIWALKMWSNLPAIYKIVVTSRNEVDIARTFQTTLHRSVEISTGQSVTTKSSEDIHTFFKHEFQLIRAQNYGLGDWPGPDIINELTKQAAGLFIWAATFMRLIMAGEPVEQLSRLREGDSAGNMASLYSLTLTISFPNPSHRVQRAFQTIVGAIVMARTPMSSLSLQNLLSIESSAMNYICNGLHSVLETGPVLKIGHQCFVDFVIDPEKCPPPFLIQMRQESRKLVTACLSTMKGGLRFNICNLQSSFIKNSDIPNRESSIEKYIPIHLRYSCYYWVDHLLETDFDEDIWNQVRWFMENAFLWWLEVLSLTKSMNMASNMLVCLINWIQVSFFEKLEILKDEIDLRYRNTVVIVPLQKK